MNNPVSNKDYPVDFTWTFKKPLGFILGYGLAFICVILFVIVLAASETNKPFPISLIVVISLFLTVPLIAVSLAIFFYQYFLRKNFSYLVGEDFMVFQQGIINKEQKNLPYGVIQDLIITQDIFDRLFNTVSLIIENAASSGGLQMAYRQRSKYPLTIGFYSNTAIIPGLSINNALRLKEIILNKIKTKSFNHDGSGL